jgi:GTP-sensing pleiotropic transcriptional regulator CodY
MRIEIEDRKNTDTNILKLLLEKGKLLLLRYCEEGKEDNNLKVFFINDHFTDNRNDFLFHIEEISGKVKINGLFYYDENKKSFSVHT